jgi:hypothetical protein
VYAKLKKMKIPSGEMVLEINYLAFMAYSGPYKVVGQEMGDHDGDWEHITVRCTPDGKLIAGAGLSMLYCEPVGPIVTNNAEKT